MARDLTAGLRGGRRHAAACAPGAGAPAARAAGAWHGRGPARRPRADRRRRDRRGPRSVQLRWWVATDAAASALEADAAAARAPSAAARAQDHKLGGERRARRYTAPSYEVTRADGGGAIAIPGFNPVEAYESAFHNLAPELERRSRPDGVAELLDWAQTTPLATAEVALILQVGATKARAKLARVATPTAAGADFYWSA